MCSMAFLAKITSALLVGSMALGAGCGHEAKSPPGVPSRIPPIPAQQQTQALYPYARSNGPSGIGGSPGRGGGLDSGSEPEVVDGMRVYRVDGHIKAPQPIYTPGLDCSTLSTEGQDHREVILWAVIGSDGRVHKARLLRPLNTESSERALEIVAKWKFVPAYKERRPVAVQVNLTVDSCT